MTASIIFNSPLVSSNITTITTTGAPQPVTGYYVLMILILVLLLGIIISLINIFYRNYISKKNVLQKKSFGKTVMFCPNCHQKATKEDIFCENCGNRL